LRPRDSTPPTPSALVARRAAGVAGVTRCPAVGLVQGRTTIAQSHHMVHVGGQRHDALRPTVHLAEGMTSEEPAAEPAPGLGVVEAVALGARRLASTRSLATMARTPPPFD